MATAVTKRSAVIGVFDTREQAHRAVEELHQAGFPHNHITVVMHHDHHRGVEITDMDASKAAWVTGDTKAGNGAAVGALAGGLSGGALALAVGLIPGVGPVLSAGVLAAAFFGVGAAVGAVGGGIVGALVGQDFPEAEAQFYEAQLKAGKVLVGVHQADRLDEARAILDRAGGQHEYAHAVPALGTEQGVHRAPPTQPAIPVQSVMSTPSTTARTDAPVTSPLNPPPAT